MNEYIGILKLVFIIPISVLYNTYAVLGWTKFVIMGFIIRSIDHEQFHYLDNAGDISLRVEFILGKATRTFRNETYKWIQLWSGRNSYQYF